MYLDVIFNPFKCIKIGNLYVCSRSSGCVMIGKLLKHKKTMQLLRYSKLYFLFRVNQGNIYNIFKIFVTLVLFIYIL